MFNFILNRLSFVVIILVTAFAFSAGLIQNNFTTRANEARSLASEHELTGRKIDIRLRSILAQDKQFLLSSVDHFFDASVFGLKYWAFFSSLTLLEQLNMELDFVQAMLEGKGKIESTLSFQIHDQFMSTSDDSYIIAETAKKGFDYIITRETWEDFTPFFTLSQQNFFTTRIAFSDILTDPNIITLLTDLNNLQPSYIYYGFAAENIDAMLGAPLENEISEEIRLKNLADNLESSGNVITMGVSITTVATILATAMANRLGNKQSDHNYSVLRADFKNNSKYVVSEHDYLAYMGLLIAVSIAVFGLLLPGFLIIIGN